MALISRAKSSKVRSHFVNIKSKGAKIDGTTNDLPALQAAIDSITKGTIVIPAGSCYLEGTVRSKTGITIQGEGPNTTKLIFGGNFYTATPKLWDDGTFTTGDVVKDHLNEYRVCISLTGGSADYPEDSQSFIKDLSILPAAAPSVVYSGIGVYGKFTEGAIHNVSTDYFKVGLEVGLENSEVTGASKYTNGEFGIIVLENSAKAIIQKASVENNTVGIKIMPNSKSISLHTVDFKNCYIPLKVHENCRAISVISPNVEGLTKQAWQIHPSSEVQFTGDITTPGFVGKVTSNKQTLKNQRPINLVKDGFMQEPAYDGTPWELNYSSLGDSGETPFIRKVFSYPSDDGYLNNSLFEGDRRLYVDPKDANDVVISGSSQYLGFLDWEYSCREDSHLRLYIFNNAETLVYDSNWLPGTLTSGTNQKINPAKVTGSLFGPLDNNGTDGPYKINILSSGTSPFYINKLAIYKGYNGFDTDGGTDMDPTIAAVSGFRIYEWAPGSTVDSEYVRVDLTPRIDDYKFMVGFWAQPMAGQSGDGPWKLGVGPGVGTSGIENATDVVYLYDNGEYQYFEFILSTEQYITLYKPSGLGLNMAGLGGAELWDVRDANVISSGIPTYGWWPLGTTVLNRNASSGQSWGWTCIENSTFPNNFFSNRGTSVQYTWSGTHLGIKTDTEEDYTYVNLSGDGLEFVWSGTSLGIRISGTGQDYVYEDLGGISGLQGPQGLQGIQGLSGLVGATGVAGPSGKSLEYNWDGTQLGVRVSGIGDYSYVDLVGASGQVGLSGLPGAVGAQGDPGTNLQFVWSGSSLGVRVSGLGDYVYEDLGGISGLQGIQGDRGLDLQYNWNGTELGVRVSGIGSYSYVDLQGAPGAAGSDGAKGLDAIYGKLVISDGLSFVKDSEGTYNINSTTVTATFYSGLSQIAEKYAEIRQSSDIPYTYYESEGTGEDITYSGVRDGKNKTYLVSFTHDSSSVELTTTIAMLQDGSDGVDGATGPTGATGATGEQGNQGATGSGILYDWASTQLGIKTYDEFEYTYVDLKGESGIYPYRLNPHISQFNISGELLATDQANFEAALAANYGQTLVVDLPVRLSDNTTIGANSSLYFTASGKLEVDDGYKVIFSPGCSFQDTTDQIFDFKGSVKVEGRINHSFWRPEWFGYFPEDGNANTMKCLNEFYQHRRDTGNGAFPNHWRFRNKVTYWTNEPLRFSAQGTAMGESTFSSEEIGSRWGGATLRNIEGKSVIEADPAYASGMISRVGFHGLRFWGLGDSGENQTDFVVKATSLDLADFQHCGFHYCNYGLYSTSGQHAGAAQMYQNCYFVNNNSFNNSGIHMEKNSHFSSCIIENNTITCAGSTTGPVSFEGCHIEDTHIIVEYGPIVIEKGDMTDVCTILLKDKAHDSYIWTMSNNGNVYIRDMGYNNRVRGGSRMTAHDELTPTSIRPMAYRATRDMGHQILQKGQPYLLSIPANRDYSSDYTLTLRNKVGSGIFEDIKTVGIVNKLDTSSVTGYPYQHFWTNLVPSGNLHLITNKDDDPDPSYKVAIRATKPVNPSATMLAEYKKSDYTIDGFTRTGPSNVTSAMTISGYNGQLYLECSGNTSSWHFRQNLSLKPYASYVFVSQFTALDGYDIPNVSINGQMGNGLVNRYSETPVLISGSLYQMVIPFKTRGTPTFTVSMGTDDDDQYIRCAVNTFAIAELSDEYLFTSSGRPAVGVFFKGEEVYDDDPWGYDYYKYVLVAPHRKGNYGADRLGYAATSGMWVANGQYYRGDWYEDGSAVCVALHDHVNSGTTPSSDPANWWVVRSVDNTNNMASGNAYFRGY